MAYGNLAVSLQGGSFNLGGAGAGGGLEVGTIGTISLPSTGLIEANGASNSIFGGGGSGGGIFLHGAVIDDEGGLVEANGGNGGNAGFIGGPGGGSGGGGGGGGGGRILLEASSFNTLPNEFEVNGGLGGSPATGTTNGMAGSVTYLAVTPVPEPGSLGMMAMSAALWLGYHCKRQRRPMRS